jgi:hypothetical protein
MGVSLSNHNPRVEDADFRFEITSGFKKQYANLQHFLQNVPEVTSLLEEPIKETGIAISVAPVVNADEEAISAERDWQYKLLPEHLRLLVFSGPNR